MKHKLLFFLIDLFASISLWAQSGTFGQVNWTIQDSVLTISGSGSMIDDMELEYISYIPWRQYAIKTVVICDGVKNIGQFAFYNCPYLTSITIPNSVTKIGKRAFEGCHNLISIIIPSSIRSIGARAFYDCTGLSSVNIPNYVSTIGGSAFMGVLNIIYNGNATGSPWGAKYMNKYVEEPFVFEDESKATLVGGRFTNLAGQITIPNSVVNIGNYAFKECGMLTSIIIPNSVKTIGSHAFQKCTSLTTVSLSDSISSIERRTFDGCIRLTSVTIPNNVIVIDSAAFYGCSRLSSIAIGNGVTTIGEQAFYNCTALTSVTIPHSVTCLGNSSFYHCMGLTSLSIGNSVATIGKYAFYGCSGITSIILPNSVISIGDSTFFNCNHLSSLSLGNSITTIGKYAFYGCTGLTSVTIPNSIITIGKSAFGACSGISSVTIGNGVTTIGGSAFSGCSGLTSVSLGDSVTTIGRFAFSGCSGLTSVIIPNSVDSIGDYAFENCNSLSSVYMQKDEPANIGNNAFGRTGYGFNPPTIYVPCGTLDSYRRASNWSSYSNRIKYIPSSYTISVSSQDVNKGTTSVPQSLTICDTVLTITASPKVGYHFVQWSDGETENPRTISFSHDTAFVAEFAQSFSGQCGDSLYWSYGDSTLSFSGSGDMYNYSAQTAPWTLFVDSIKNVDLSLGMTSIGHNAFYGCSKLTSISIPKNISSIYYTAFSYCYNLETIVVDSGNAIYDSRENCNAIIQTAYNSLIVGCKNSLIPNSVTTIGNYAYHGRSGMTTIVIPSNVTYIYQNAFLECTGRINVIWNVKQIGNYSYSSAPFYNIRTNISSFVFGDSVEHVPSYLCYGMSDISSVTISPNITSVGEYAFAYCSNLTSLSFLNSVTSVGNRAFYRCNKLTDVFWNTKNSITYSSSTSPFVDVRSQITSFVFGDSVQSVSDSLCYGMTNLSSVTISEDVTNIGQNTFAGCTEIDSVIWNARNCADFTTSPFNDAHESIVSFSLGDNVQHIPANLCNGMKRLKEFTIPASVESIGDNVFGGCDSLTKVDISNLSAWGSTDFISSSAEIYVNGAKPKKIEIPDGVTRVGAYTFRNCSQVSEVVLPSTVTEIAKGAFANGNRLQVITLDSALETIGDSAFANCPYLLTIYANMNFPPVINYSVFANCGTLSGIDCYVPHSALTLYKKAPVWQSLHLIGEQKHTVIFLDWDGTVLSTQNVVRGEDATPPANPSRIGYEFDGWSNNYTNIQENTFVIAQYDKQLTGAIPVFFVDAENNVLLTSYIVNAAPEAPIVESKPFVGWHAVEGDIRNGIIIRATYEEQDSSINSSAEEISTVRKIFHNGQLLILLPDGTRFDATGKRVE